MLSLCRLCVNSLDGIEISSEISELEPKLKLCCGWTPSEHEWRLPQRACRMCVDELQRSWSFAKRIQAAEQQLIKLTSEISFNESEPTIHIEEVTTSMIKEELYVDSNPVEEVEHDFDSGAAFDDPINTSEAESLHSNESKSNKRKKPTKRTKKSTNKTKSTSNAVRESNSNERRPKCDNTRISGVRKYRKKKDKESRRKTIEAIKSNLDAFLAPLNDEDRLPHGKITSNGVAKLEKLFPDMKTMTWADCQFKCKECNQIFQSPQNFFVHNRSFHLKQTKSMYFFCNYCDSKYQLEYTLNKHIAKEHFPHLWYSCYFCEEYYWEPDELIKHRNTHKDVEYKCEHCGKITFNRDALHIHVAQRHFDRKYIDPEAPFICDICSKVCATKTSIKTHMLRHTQQFDFVCDQCGWKFRTKGNLKSHLITTHGNLRLFSCKQCDKRFKTKPQLDKHAKGHEGYKPFHCQVCEKRFRTRSCLTVHMRSHSKVCPYSCKWCGKKFSYTSGLKIHERTHTAEKPYACTICEYRSTNWPNLQKHSLQVHSFDLRVKKDSKSGLN